MHVTYCLAVQVLHALYLFFTHEELVMTAAHVVPIVICSSSDNIPMSAWKFTHYNVIQNTNKPQGLYDGSTSTVNCDLIMLVYISV